MENLERENQPQRARRNTRKGHKGGRNEVGSGSNGVGSASNEDRRGSNEVGSASNEDRSGNNGLR